MVVQYTEWPHLMREANSGKALSKTEGIIALAKSIPLLRLWTCALEQGRSEKGKGAVASNLPLAMSHCLLALVRAVKLASCEMLASFRSILMNSSLHTELEASLLFPSSRHLPALSSCYLYCVQNNLLLLNSIFFKLPLCFHRYWYLKQLYPIWRCCLYLNDHLHGPYHMSFNCSAIVQQPF